MPPIPVIKSKLSTLIKVGADNNPTAPAGCFQQRRFQRPGIVYFFLIFFVLIAVLHTLTPYAPQRSFSENPRPEKCQNCFPYIYSNVIAPRDMCKPKEAVDIVLLITTVPNERRERDAIRATWCNHTAMGTHTMRCVFLFGYGYSKASQQSLLREAQVHNDILQDSYFDSYYKLSIKVLMGYRWVMRACSQAKYVIRTAGDNYVNVPQVLELLRAKGEEQLQNFMLGSCRSNVMVWRWPYHRWVVSFKEYPNFFFPPYCIGTTFVTSYKVMAEIVRISVDVPFFPIEDVYFGMCLQQYQNKYKLALVDGFNTPLVSWSEMFSGGPSSPCSYPRPWYSIHDVSPTDMRRIWQGCSTSEIQQVKSLSNQEDEDLRLNNIYAVNF